MSYSDKRSGIVFAIATTFVIAGSTSSHAVPPQAITEEVKSCKAIPSDQQRLKCFDSLFADKPNQTKPLEKSANEDNWSIEESKSSMDGSQQIVAANLVGDTVLILRCKDQTTEAAFSTRSVLLWLQEYWTGPTVHIYPLRTVPQGSRHHHGSNCAAFNRRDVIIDLPAFLPTRNAAARRRGLRPVGW
jgi:hypothetical protein